MKPSIGIIGNGNFGRYLAKWLEPHAQVRLVGRASSEDDYTSALDTDAVILAIPFEAYPSVLQRLSGRLRPDTLLVDVCSIKQLPVQIVREALPGQPLLAIHPLFGPETAPDSLEGQTVVLCPQPDASPIEAWLEKHAEGVGLAVVKMTPEEHDRLMADLQALTFFVSRTLLSYGVEKREVMTPSYRQLLKLADLERHHSLELFRTIQQGNPYSAAARQRFLELANQLNDELSDGEA